VDLHTRLRIATRIHFALLRHLGESIDVAVMLQRPAEAREVLWVCEASGDAELMALARQYHRAVALEAGHHAPQDAAWASNTSGFGLSRPAGTPAVAQAAPTRPPASAWAKSVDWLRRGHHASR
jgi:hypothetical protein